MSRPGPPSRRSPGRPFVTAIALVLMLALALVASGPAAAVSAGPGQVVFVSPASGATVSSPVEIAYLHTPACEVDHPAQGPYGQNMLPPVVVNTATGKNEMEIAPGLGRRIVASPGEVGLDSVFVTAFELSGGSPIPRQGVQRAERIVMGLPDGTYEVRFTQFVFCAGNSEVLRFTVGAGGGGGAALGPRGPTPGEILACEQLYDRDIASQDRQIAALRAGPQTADAKGEIDARESFRRKLGRDRGRCAIILAGSTPAREQAKIALEELAASSRETADRLLKKAVDCLVPDAKDLLRGSITKRLVALWDTVCVGLTGGLGAAAAGVSVGADAGARSLDGGATANERLRSSHAIPAVRPSALLDAGPARALRRLVAAETAAARLTARLRAAGAGVPAALPRQLAAKLRALPRLRAAARAGLVRAQRALPPALRAARYRPDRTRLAALRRDLRARLTALGATRSEVTAALRALRPRERARVDLVSLLPPTRRRDAAERIAADALDALSTSLAGGT